MKTSEQLADQIIALAADAKYPHLLRDEVADIIRQARDEVVIEAVGAAEAWVKSVGWIDVGNPDDLIRAVGNVSKAYRDGKIPDQENE